MTIEHGGHRDAVPISPCKKEIDKAIEKPQLLLDETI